MEVSKPACMACKYSSGSHHGVYECRAKPPTYDYKNPYRRFFPIVEPDDWCAKYKFNEKFKIKIEPEPEPEPKLNEDFQRALAAYTEDYDED